jgi:cytochrome P450
MAYRSLMQGAGERARAKGGCPFVEGVAKDLAALEFEDDLSYGGVVPKTVGAFLAGNLFDGFHTAALAVANTLHVMLRNPDALEAVRRAPEKAAAAVAESLRLESPVIHLNRIATGEVRCGDAIIPQGTQVVLMWGAANHDPQVFPDADRFDLGRSQQGATTFGGGAHICPGRFAASLIARAALEGLLQSGLDARPVAGAERWVDNNAMAQLERLPVTLERRLTG